MDEFAIDGIGRNALGGTWWYDLETREIWWSRAIYRIHDVDPDEYTPTPETVVTFYEPESQVHVRQAIERAINEGAGWSLTLLMRRKSGELHYVHSVAEVEQRPGKAPVLAGAFFDIHESTVARIAQHAREQRLSEEQHARRWRMAGENAGLALMEFDARSYSLSGTFAQHLGLSDGSEVRIPTARWRGLIHPDDREVRRQRLEAHLAGETEFYVSEYRLNLRDQDEIWVQEAGRRADASEDGGGDRLIGTLSDITERKRAERAVFQAKELAEVTFEAIGEGMMRIDRDGRITEANPAACALLGYAADDLIGARFADRVKLYDAARKRRLPDPGRVVLEAGRRVRVPIFTRLKRADGTFLSIVDSVSPIHDEAGGVRGVVFVFQDVSDAREMTQEWLHQANHDPLTGLLNRRGFQDALDRAWHRVGSGQTQAYVVYFDLDHFKRINDECGHAAGDEFLRQVAATFRATLRTSDVVARLGGDEFAAIVQSRHTEGVHAIAEKLISAVKALQLPVGNRVYQVGVSLGIAAVSAEFAASETALHHADIALYRAKEAGRNGYRFFESMPDSDVGDECS